MRKVQDLSYGTFGIQEVAKVSNSTGIGTLFV
jgi:hypothetical protein